MNKIEHYFGVKQHLEVYDKNSRKYITMSFNLYNDFDCEADMGDCSDILNNYLLKIGMVTEPEIDRTWLQSIEHSDEELIENLNSSRKLIKFKTYEINKYLSEKFDSFDTGRIVLINSPTGSGKTVNILKRSEKKPVLMVVPYTVLVKQAETKANNFQFLYDDRHYNSLDSNTSVCCTYDKFTAMIKNGTDFSKFEELHIDEIHEIYTSANINFRFKAVSKLTTVFDKFQKVFLYSGTFDHRFSDIRIDNHIIVKVKDAKQRKVEVVYTPNRIDACLSAVINSEFKSIIYLNDKEELDIISQHLEKHNVKCQVLTARTKNDEDNNDIFAFDRIKDDTKVLLCTSIAITGLSLLNADISDIHYLDSNIDLVTVMQLIARPRVANALLHIYKNNIYVRYEQIIDKDRQTKKRKVEHVATTVEEMHKNQMMYDSHVQELSFYKGLIKDTVANNAQHMNAILKTVDPFQRKRRISAETNSLNEIMLGHDLQPVYRNDGSVISVDNILLNHCLYIAHKKNYANTQFLIEDLRKHGFEVIETVLAEVGQEHKEEIKVIKKSINQIKKETFNNTVAQIEEKQDPRQLLIVSTNGLEGNDLIAARAHNKVIKDYIKLADCGYKRDVIINGIKNKNTKRLIKDAKSNNNRQSVINRAIKTAVKEFTKEWGTMDLTSKQQMTIIEAAQNWLNMLEIPIKLSLTKKISEKTANQLLRSAVIGENGTKKIKGKVTRVLSIESIDIDTELLERSNAKVYTCGQNEQQRYDNPAKRYTDVDKMKAPEKMTKLEKIKAFCSKKSPLKAA